MRFVDPHNFFLEGLFNQLALGIKKNRWFIFMFFLITMISGILLLSFFPSGFGAENKKFTLDLLPWKNFFISFGFFFLMILLLTKIFLRSKIALFVTTIPWLWSLVLTILAVNFFFPGSSEYLVYLSLCGAFISGFSFQLYSYFKTQKNAGVGITQIITALYFVQGKKTLRIYLPIFLTGCLFLFQKEREVQILGFMISVSLLFSWFGNSILLPALIYIFEKYSSINEILPQITAGRLKRVFLWLMVILLIIGIGILGLFEVQLRILSSTNFEQEQVNLLQLILMMNSSVKQVIPQLVVSLNYSMLIVFIFLVILFMVTLKKISGLIYYFVPLLISYLSIWAALWILQQLWVNEWFLFSSRNYYILPLLNALSFSSIYLLYTNLRRSQKQDLDMLMKETSNDLFWLYFAPLLAFISILLFNKDFSADSILAMTLLGVSYGQYLLSFPLTVIVMKKILYRNSFSLEKV